MNIRDDILRHTGSKDSKDSGSDSDSLEYSNDDQSWNNKDETADKKRPPVHPLSTAEDLDSQDKNANISTPKRKQDGSKQYPGPLHLFSPGLSPIGHAGGPKDSEPKTADNVKAVPFSTTTPGRSNEDIYRQDLNNSVDSLDMSSEFFRDEPAPESGAQSLPHYRFWKNKLFGEDAGDTSFSTGDEQRPEIDERDGLRSNNQSFDSDIHVTKQSLVYPTTEAVYANSEQDALDYSMDSDIQVTKQSLVYPTTAALYERTAPPRSPISSPRLAAQRADTSLLLKQSLLSHPAEEAPVSARRDLADDEAEGEEEDRQLMKESFLHASFGPDRSMHNFTFSNISLLNDSASSSFDQTPHDASMRSISLLPGSPVMMSTYGLQDRDLPHHQPQRGAGSRARAVPADAKRVNIRPSAAAVRLKQLVTSSDTEFVSSTSRRRAAEAAARAAPHARDTSDLMSSAPKDLQLAMGAVAQQPQRATSPPKQTRQAQSGQHQSGSADTSGRYAPRSTSAPSQLNASLGYPSPSVSVSSTPGSQHSAAASAHSPEQHASQPQASFANMTAQSHAQLVVGGLYTLLLDSQGRPAFVPVLASPQASQELSPGIHGASTAPAPQFSPQAQYTSYQSYQSAAAPPTPPAHQQLYQQHYHQQHYQQQPQQQPQQQYQSGYQYAPPTVHPQVAVRPDPYRNNFAPPSVLSPPDPREAYNSNHIDLEKVLDRALNHGSLSASKLDKRWRESPPGSAGASDSDRGSGREGGAYYHSDISSPTYKRPANTAQTPTLTRVPPKSPFRVGLTEDGKEQLLPGSEYWRERLLMLTLTSALPRSDLSEVSARKSRGVLSPPEARRSSPDWLADAAAVRGTSERRTLRF